MVRKIFVCVWMTTLFFVGHESIAQKTLVSSEGTLKDKFSKKLGSLMLSATALKFGRLKTNTTKMDTIRIFNSGNKPMSLSVAKVPDHLKVNLKSPVIEANAESWITVAFDASKKNDFGFVLDRFDLVTNDSAMAKKIISITATLEEAFPVMTADDSLQAPRARWNETTFDFGSIRQGDKIHHDFVIQNDGKKDLVIHKTKSACGCIKTSFSKMTIAAGESALVKVEYDSFGKEGKESRKLDVFLNDYIKPSVTIEMKGDVTK